MCLKNLIHIDCEEYIGKDISRLNGEHSNFTLDNSVALTITYGRQQLIEMGHKCKQDKRITLFPSAVNRIRKLKLNRRGKRSGKKVREQSSYRKKLGVNHENLTLVTPFHRNNNSFKKNLKCLMINIQSIKSKQTLLMDYIVDNEIDLVMVTETWLSDSDNIWLEVSDLNKYGYAARSRTGKIEEVAE